MADDSVKGAKAIHEWYAEYGAEQEMGDVKFCFVHPHAPGTLHSKEKITSPEGVKGKNVRPAHATMARFVRPSGRRPRSGARTGSGAEALARGTAEAVTFPWGSMYDFKLTDEVNQHLDMPFYLSAQVLLMNKASYDKLSDENKAVIDEHCTPEWSAKVAQGWFDDDMAAREKLIADPEQTLNEPTEGRGRRLARRGRAAARRVACSR